MWLPEFTCPSCRGVLADEAEERRRCPTCGLSFEWRRGVYRFLTPALETASAPFLRQYRRVRERDGFRSRSPQHYRMLPYVPPGDSQAAQWRLRRESYAHLVREALPLEGAGALKVLDIGAGCGWLSHRLASLGHHVVAVDLLDDEADGLGACRFYDIAFPAVQADFNHLPLADGQFELAVFGGALHYAPSPASTVDEACRVLAPGGTLVVMDSPVFAREADGEAMVTSQLDCIRRECDVKDAVRPGVGFLTYRGVERLFRERGYQVRFRLARGPLAWRLRRQIGRLRLGRAPAAFGVWIARQAG
jgi:SAM-dependent methyltransferase